MDFLNALPARLCPIAIETQCREGQPAGKKTINIGNLIVSQRLTRYTTPRVYLYLVHFQLRRQRKSPRLAPIETPAFTRE